VHGVSTRLQDVKHLFTNVSGGTLSWTDRVIYCQS